MLQPNHFFLRTIVLTLQAQTKQARYTSKLRRASRMFAKSFNHQATLTYYLQRHFNGINPFRTLEKFVEHNSDKELAEVGNLSAHALKLSELTGREYQLCHLWALCRGHEIDKVNNVSNLIVLLRETNQMIGKRCISRTHAEVLDRLVFSGNYLAARVFADQVCF